MTTATPDPLVGPFMTSRHLTDYRDQPGYAVLPSSVPSGDDAAAWTLARLGYTRDDEKAA